MSGVSKIGDVAGGSLVTGSSNVIVNGAGAVRVGDVVQGHGDGEHSGPSMVTGSPTVFVNGIPLCRAGDVASCGHAITGSSNVFSG
jgi:uncharacterized Zn-binding protein involved in type VI secretion